MFNSPENLTAKDAKGRKSLRSSRASWFIFFLRESHRKGREGREGKNFFAFFVGFVVHYSFWVAVPFLVVFYPIVALIVLSSSLGLKGLVR
jgi:hypothetical protein